MVGCINVFIELVRNGGIAFDRVSAFNHMIFFRAIQKEQYEIKSYSIL
jgi:hypothetical protein